MKNCQYYPCHKDMEDCSLCYCPIYPCEEEGLGKFYKGVWDCSNCNIVHKKEIVWQIQSIIRQYAKKCRSSQKIKK